MAIIAFVGTAVACAGVPELNFEDAGGDGASGVMAISDATADATADAAVEAASAGCPAVIPPGAAACCGGAVCVGACGASQCSLCEGLSCRAGESCCAHANNVVCHAAGAPCN